MTLNGLQLWWLTDINKQIRATIVDTEQQDLFFNEWILDVLKNAQKIKLLLDLLFQKIKTAVLSVITFFVFVFFDSDGTSLVYLMEN